MSRYKGTAHQLADSGPTKRGNWNTLMKYLEGHSVGDPDGIVIHFESPLPPSTSPSKELEKELITLEGPRREDTPLRIAVRTAPAPIVAALCHLGPNAAKLTDSKGRIPLHWACRRPFDSEVEKIMLILVRTYPQGLLSRDDAGRTPLHWIFWYHARSRSLKVIKLFCQALDKQSWNTICVHNTLQQPPQPDDHPQLPQIPTPDPRSKIPPSAAIVYDSKHGALPLFYAVTQGASKEIIRYLLTVYPPSKHLTDKRGRTALAWYLGAGQLRHQPEHICGEPPDLTATPLYEQRISSSTIQLLLNSKVARTVDDLGRYPLHWAAHLSALHCYNNESSNSSSSSAIPTTTTTTNHNQEYHFSCLSLKSLQMLLDTHVDALIGQCQKGQTPLHVLFDIVREQQELDWKRLQSNVSVRQDVDIVRGGPGGFAPPLSLVELFLQAPDTNKDDPHTETTQCAAQMEDDLGNLPLHLSLTTASTGEIIQTLIQAYPAALVHTTEEEVRTPLHMALCHPYTSPLQTINAIMVMLQAYVTSRHGTYVNGRLALKMEDAFGRYPLHYACRNQACLDVIRLLLEKYPKAATVTDGDGDLPLHLLLSDNLFGTAGAKKNLVIGATLSQPKNWTSLGEDNFMKDEQTRVMKQKMQLLIEPISKDASSLQEKSSSHGMMPLHIGVAFASVSYPILYNMLVAYPEAALHICQIDESKDLSALDLLELRANPNQRDLSGDDNKSYVMVQELLFAFGPTLDNHRQKTGLLERCCTIIRDESEQGGKRRSAHKQAQTEMQEEDEGVQEIDIAADSFVSFEKPNAKKSAGGRPQRSKSTRGPRQTTMNRVFALASDDHMTSLYPKESNDQSSKRSKQKERKKSIYDEDDDNHGYKASPNSSFADDDSEYFSEDKSEEEYFSDEYDSRYDENLGIDRNSKSKGKRSPGKKNKVKAKRTNESEASDINNQMSGMTLDDDSDSSCESADEFDKSPMSPMSLAKKKKKEYKRNEPIELSNVAMRLWTFFNLFCGGPGALEDHYGVHIESILEDLNFKIVEELVNMQLPSYASSYLSDDIDIKKGGLTVRDVANVHCKAVIAGAYHFVGLYDFKPTTEGGILLHRSTDSNIICVRATELSIVTEDKGLKVEGGDEEDIWATGAVSQPKAIFQEIRKSVCFKFFKDQAAYENEVRCRSDVGVPVEDIEGSSGAVVPLKNHFNRYDEERRGNRRYKRDTNDDRFTTLFFQADESTEKGRSLCLTDYPFAIVSPLSEDGNLYEHFMRQGMLGTDHVRKVLLQVGQSLRSMHTKAVVHANVSMSNIVHVASSEEGNAEKRWALTNLHNACRLNEQPCYAAEVSSNGSAQISNGSFPPEMFAMLPPNELQQYNDYWTAVERIHKITVDKEIIEPRIDAETGDVHVLCCHYMGKEIIEDSVGKFSLPYKLVPVREMMDLWSFGLILFTLCSSGRPLSPINLRTGNLLTYELISNWDQETAHTIIYKHIEHPLTQDILLHLLGSPEERVKLTMKAILMHPFFTNPSTADKDVRRLIDQRLKAKAAHKLTVGNIFSKHAGDLWLQKRSTTILSWDFDFQMRLQRSPTELMKKVFNVGKNAPTTPYSFVVLPYRLARNKAGKITPVTKKDVERAERMGKQMLKLSKACHFAALMERVIKKKPNKSTSWSASEISASMGLTSDDFKDLESEMISLASKEVELFRDDPLYVAKKLIRNSVREMKDSFEESKKAFVYFVDEYEGLPIIGDGSHELNHKISDVVERSLPCMHMCQLYLRGLTGSISSLVKLIFQAAYPHIPPSWELESKGLNMYDAMEEDDMLSETRMLCAAIGSNTRSSAAGLRYVETLFQPLDPTRNFSGLQRVTNGKTSLWTSKEGVKSIQEKVNALSFSEAYCARKADEEKMRAQDITISKLQERLEELEFRREHNLTAVPDEVM